MRLILTLVFVAATFVAGYAWRDLASGRPPKTNPFASSVDSAPTATEIYRQNLGLILSRAERPVAPDRMKYAAMEGMFAALGDPHTNFLEPQAADDLRLETRGDFVGIGARLSPDPLGATVATVFKNAPAESAGLKPGDTIVWVDGKDTTGEDVDDIVSRIRGKEGTNVKLRVVRADVAEPIELRITRAVVVIPTAEGRMLPGTQVGYVNVTQFAETTAYQFEQSMKEVLSERPKAVVIDLRGNPGGLLDVARDMLGLFVEGRTVVTMKFRGEGEERVLTPSGRTLANRVPMVVLMNEESASAAEIFAGAMRDYRLATLVGEHSYGKASVQKVFNLLDLSSAKVTIAKYFLPSGTDISRKVDEDGEYLSGGLEPDVDAKLPLTGVVIGDPEKDAQLKEAVRVALEKAAR